MKILVENIDSSKRVKVFTKHQDLKNRDKDAARRISKNQDLKIIDKVLKAKIKYLESQYLKVENISKIIEFPKVGEQLRLITQQQFNAFTLILHILQNYKIAESVTLIVYSIDAKTIASIFDMLDDGIIQQLTIVLSSPMKKLQPKRYEQLKSGFQKRKHQNNIRIALTENHAKITLIKCSENYFVIEGSGNFSSNARIEQYLFENNKQSFDFHMSWLNEIVFKPETLKWKRLEIFE